LCAAQGPMEKFADKNIDMVEKNCITELETYCQTVTPGEGRGMACLYAHNDKLSGSCSAALNEATNEFKNATDNVNAFIADCQADIYQLCSKVAIGEGRILACLEKNKKKVTAKCRDQLKNAHGDFGKANQIT
ncbi:MAG: cysteine rich repeat-containing protein, partial [Candidatus Omnitrophota bacterium]